MCSASAVYGQRELATYSASKFAMRGLTEALDLEWAADDITVSSVWPLYVETGMLDDVDIATTRNVGVGLTADDVANTVLSIVNNRQFGPRAVHHGVGLKARALLAAHDLAPSFVLREFNKFVSRN